MLDLHAHILPGIDDGPRTTEDALLLLRALQDEGVQHVVATPHIYPGVYDNTPERIAQVFTAFRQQAEAAGLTLGMSWGAEVRLCPEVLDWLDAGTLVALGDGDKGRRTVLLEMPDGQVPVGADRLVARLVSRGWQPLIAHPERNRQVMEHPTALEPLLAAGAVFQLTAASLLGDFGQRAQAAAQRLLALDGAVMAVASDTHNLKGRRPQMKAARAWLVEQFGEARAHDLTERQPARLVGVGQVVFEGRDGTVLRDLTGAVTPGGARAAGPDLVDFPAAGVVRAGTAPVQAPAARSQDWDLGFAWSAPAPGPAPVPSSTRVSTRAPSRPPVIEPLMPSPPAVAAAPAVADAAYEGEGEVNWPPQMDFEPTAPDVMSDLRRPETPGWVLPSVVVPAPMPAPAPAPERELPLEARARVVSPGPRVPTPPLPLRAGMATLAEVPVLSDVSARPVTAPTPAAPVRAAALAVEFADVEQRKPLAQDAMPPPAVAKVPVAAPAPAPVKAAAPHVARPVDIPDSPKGQETVHLPRAQTRVEPGVPRPSGSGQGFKLGDFDVRLDPAKSR